METITLELIPLLEEEMHNEAVTTRKMLSRVPPEKFDWQPHPKSMTLKQLAAHIAELPGWVTTALTTDELDFEGNPYTPQDVKSTGELLDFFEASLKSGKQSLAEADANILTEDWVLRSGSHIINTRNRYEVIRMAYSQIVHHRAQLGIYLRLLNIPIPGSYGPSADEK